jgi:hypothetical protein
MTPHPENSPEVNQLITELAKHNDVIKVWCKQCNDWRPVNAAYVKYLGGEIENCSKCR